MGRGSQWLLGSAVSGDGRKLLQEGFLAECVEGQVPPDIGTNGSNLGRWKGRGRENSPLQTAEGTVRGSARPGERSVSFSQL